MVEILTLGRYCDWISTQASQKGLKGAAYRQMALICWCLGEVIGLFIGLSIAPFTEIVALPLIYLSALMGAAAGALMVYLVVRSIKPDPVHAALTAFPTIGK